ncbi:MAG TPA: tetratricopeptide repeat protein, partial [Candidatus Omnitrophota bacterium]|nr:tetratricopeptide repeat protein [Candidatus Omnitrophota bacterium]
IPRSLLTYGRLIFFPYDIHYYRSQDILLPFFWPLAGMIIVLLAMGWALYLAPKAQRKMMVFGLAWFLISLVPTSNIVPLFNEYSQILTAEHFLYFPLMGMLLFVAEPVHYWMTRADSGRRMHMVFVGLASVMILCIATVVRLNTYWRGEIPLFERTLHYEKNFGRVRILLAQAYASAGRLEDAIAENRRALAIMQDYNLKTSKKEVKEFYLHFIKEIRYHLGTCLDALGNWEGALEEFKEVQRLDPQNRVIYYTLGLGYLKAGDINSAVGHFEKALALNPKDLMIMNSLAICYQETGENAKAEKLLRTIAEKDKASVSAQENLRAFLQKTSIRSSDTGVTSGE